MMFKDDTQDEASLRIALVEVMRAMDAAGLNRGTSGNVSVRCGDGMLVSPSGIVPDQLTPDTIVYLDADGTPAPGAMRPSSEWRMHQRLLQRRPDANAVVHCHARHATILACANKSIPPLHYMVAVSGRAEVPVAPYALFGSAELADSVADTMGAGYACLMANHGLVTVAPGLRMALAIAAEMEEQAAVYWGALQIGGPTLLDQEQIGEVMRQFAGYGQKK